MITFQNGHDEHLNYPMTEQAVQNLGPTGLVSPCAGNPYNVPEPYKPGSPEYEQEMEDVEHVRMNVSNKVWPGWFLEKNGVESEPSPILVKYLRANKSNPARFAEYVRMDTPAQAWQEIVLPYLKEKGAKPKHLRHQGIPFVEWFEVETWGLNIISKALREAFEVKAHYGKARPFEVNSMGKDLEMYPSPTHMEYIAGHGAFCGATVRAAKELTDVSEEIIKEITTAMLQIAMARSFSAMHFASANIEGFKFGLNGPDA